MHESAPSNNLNNLGKAPVPPIDNWVLVSDPFELPKVYRHKCTLVEMKPDGKGIHVFVLERKGTNLVILKDDNFVPSAELSVLVDGNPHILGVANLIPKNNSEGFLNLGEPSKASLLTDNSLKNLETITPDLSELPYRLKYVNGKFHRENGTFSEPKFDDMPPDIRGTLDASNMKTLHQAIALSAYFNR
jgi:hypothetical protein